jgi:hypothetical protein
METALEPRMIKQEKVKQGKVSMLSYFYFHLQMVSFLQMHWRVYTDYISAIGYSGFVAIILTYTCSSALGIGMNIWLSQWSEDGHRAGNDTMTAEARLAVYAALGIGQGLLS